MGPTQSRDGAGGDGGWAVVLLGDRCGRRRPKGDVRASAQSCGALTSQIRAGWDEERKSVLARRTRTEVFIWDLFDCFNRGWALASLSSLLRRREWSRVGVRAPFLAPSDGGGGGFG